MAVRELANSANARQFKLKQIEICRGMGRSRDPKRLQNPSEFKPRQCMKLLTRASTRICSCISTVPSVSGWTAPSTVCTDILLFLAFYRTDDSDNLRRNNQNCNNDYEKSNVELAGLQINNIDIVHTSEQEVRQFKLELAWCDDPTFHSTHGLLLPSAFECELKEAIIIIIYICRYLVI